jgi:predicted MPP superfamily phosphohydrolase
MPALLGALVLGFMYSVALRDPIVRRAKVQMPDWPHGAPPLEVVLIADIHVAGPDMPPTRLSRIVAQINALRPDLVLIAGDFVSDKRIATKTYSGSEALAPLSKLRSRLGTLAVLGNHDHWRGEPEMIGAIKRSGIRLLSNDAIVVGPLSLGGADDAFTGNDDVRATVADMRMLKGARVLLSHSPDVMPIVPDDATLVLAGHTHCGQIRLPLIGAMSTMSDYGNRFSCGVVRDGPKRLIVSAGLGTSLLPLRLGAAPDLWLLTLSGQ